MDSEPADVEPCRDLLFHYEAISKQVFRRIACPHAAADLVQETYCRALRYGRRRSGDPRDLAWLRVIARNLVFDHYRDAALRRPQELTDHLDPLRFDESDHAKGPDLLDFSLEEIAKAMAGLRPTARALLTRYYFEGKNTTEIASELGIHPKTVKLRLLRARRKLRQHLVNPREVADG